MSEIPEVFREELARLVFEFPPVRIKDEDQLDVTQAVVDTLLGRERTPAEEVYLDLLGTRIEEWEDEHDQIRDIYGAELVRVLLRERGQHQRDLVRAGIFATDSVASEVLTGRRQLRLDQVLALARFFGLSPAVFLPELETPGMIAL